MLFQLAYHVGDGRLLLTNSDVDTLNAGTFLVDDGVNGHGSLTSLAVTDDQLTLTTTYRNHRVDGLVASLDGLVDRLTPDHARRNFFNCVGSVGVDVAFAVDRSAQCVNNAAQQFRTNRHFQDATGALDGHAFGQTQVVAQDYRTNGVLLQVECHTKDAFGKLEHFPVHYIGETVNPHDTVRYGKNRTFVACLRRDIELLDPLLDDVTDL